MAISKGYLFSEKGRRLANYSEAFSHPARIWILLYLQEIGTSSYTDLCEHIPLARPTIAQHLLRLRRLKLIEKGAHGKTDSGYHLNIAEMQLLKEDMLAFLDEFVG